MIVTFPLNDMVMYLQPPDATGAGIAHMLCQDVFCFYGDPFVIHAPASLLSEEFCTSMHPSRVLLYRPELSPWRRPFMANSDDDWTAGWLGCRAGGGLSDEQQRLRESKKAEAERSWLVASTQRDQQQKQMGQSMTLKQSRFKRKRWTFRLQGPD